MKDFFLDFFFPRRSLQGEAGEWITSAEWQALRSVPRIMNTAELRQRDIQSLDFVVASALYKDQPLLKKAIHTFKYRRISSLDSFLASLVIDATSSYADSSAVLVPVPLHWTRLFHRGFNQAGLLAGHIADAHGMQMQQILKRTRPTGHQAHRSREQRLHALDNAFAVTTHTLPQHIVLVDDLITTGSTLGECAKKLKLAGVKRVDAWVVAEG